MADSKRKKTSGYFVTVGTGEKIQYNSNPTRSKPKVTETQKQAAEARVQQYRSAAKENASTQSGLSKPAKITSDVSGEAWTRATPSQTKLPSGYTSSQERELSQLAELRRQAQVDLDTDTLNSVDKRMKEIRAQAGKQTGFERVGSVLSGSGKLYGGQLAGTAGTLVEGAGKLNTRIENYTNQEKLQTAEDNIKRYQQMLSSGKDLAGKALTAEDRKRIQSYIKQNQAVLDAHKNYTAAVENADKETADTLYGKSLDLIESGSKDVEKAKEDLGFVGRAAVDLGVAGTQMAADAALGTVTGTALVPMFIRSFGGGAIEAKQNGATYGQQLAYGALSAGTEVATEKISNVSGVFKKVYGGGVVDEAVKKAVKKLSSNAVGQALLTAGASAGGEGFEEFVSDVFAPIWQRATYAKDPYVSDKYGAGNIDLKNRPQYQNADGTISTVDSWSFNIDGKEVLLPSVWMKDGKPYHSSNADEIFRHYKETGEYLGKFDTVEQANAYAEKLHQEQNQYYNVYQNAKFDLGEAMYDAMIGAAMGLIGDASGKVVSGTANGVQSQIATRQVGQAVKDATGNTQNTSLISEIQKGLAADEGSKTRTLAQRAQKELDSKKTVSNKTLGNLAVENRKDLKSILENADATVAEAARAELAATGNVSTQTLAKLRASAKVSPAASAEVQQTESQAQVTQAENPDSNVLDAATTLFTQQGMKLKTAQEKADIVQKLIAGDEVSVRDINKLNPTSKESQAIFTQLTGVQFPEGKLSIEQLYTLYRSANQVAVDAREQQRVQQAAQEAAFQQAAAEQVQTMQDQQTPTAQKYIAQHAGENDAQAVLRLAQMRGEIAPDGNALLSFKEFSDFIKQQNPKATREETARLYDQYLKDNQTVEFRGQRLSHQQFMDMVRNAPRGSELTEAEAEGLWAAEVDRQRGAGEEKYSVSESRRTKESEMNAAAEQARRAENAATAKWMQDVLKPIGVQQVIVEYGTMGDNENAYIDSDGILHFNGDRMSGANAMIWTLGHELVHHAEFRTGETGNVSEDIIDAFSKLNKAGALSGVAKTWMDNVDGRVSEIKKTYQNHEASLENGDPDKVTDAYCREELAGDLMRIAFTEDNLLMRLAGEKPSLLIRSKEALSRLKAQMFGNEQIRATVDARKALDEMEKRFEKALKTSEARAIRNEPGAFTDSDGNLIVENDGKGSSRMSLLTYEESGKEILRTWLDDAVDNKQLSREDADDILKSLDTIYQVCKGYKDQYAPFSAWSDAKVVTDSNGNPVFSVVKANGDYSMNLDFSLVCKKRRTLDAVLNEMVRRGLADNVNLGQENIVRINDIIRKYGFEAACSLCFVDAKRFRQAKVADDFVKMYNDQVNSLIPKGSDLKASYFNFGGNSLIDNSGRGIETLSDTDLDFTKVDKILKTKGERTVEYKIAKHLKENAADRRLCARSDFLSTRGFNVVKKENPAVLSLFNSKKGSGGPKSAESDVQYLNEILASKTFDREKAYAVGGVRIQSFSDFVPRMVFDYVQMFADMSAKQLPGHAYTKEELFVKMFGLTGLKINMSLIPKVVDGGVAAGLDADGNYVWADESFDYDIALEIQSADGYSKNCGTIAVGVSDEHIRKLLTDPNIRMVIPYHKSGLNPVIAAMNNIGQFTDYTTVQNTRRKSTGKKLDPKVAADKKLLAEETNFNQRLHEMGENGDPQAVVAEYVEWCEENDLIPKFDQFVYKKIGDMFVEEDGHKVIDENYYKLIEDFTVYDGGAYSPQTAVKMTFPTEDSAFGSMSELIKRGLKEDAILEGMRSEKVGPIVDEISQAMQSDEWKSAAGEPGKKRSRKRYSIVNDFAAGESEEKYWRPKIGSREWELINHRKNQEFDDPAFDIDETEKWLYAKEKGTTVFAIYSKMDQEDPTILYASKGRDAEKKHNKLLMFMEDKNNEANRNRADVVGLSTWLSNKGRTAASDISDAGLRGSDTGYADLYVAEQERDRGGPVSGSEENRRTSAVTKPDAKASEESGAFNLDDYTIDDLLKWSDEDFDRAYKALGLDDILEDDILLEDLSVEDIAEELDEEPEKIEILYRRAGLGDSHVAEGTQAVMTEKRIDARIEEHGASDPSYARRYITRIAPKDFIDMTVYERNVARENFDTRVGGDFGTKMGEWDFEKALRESEEPPVLIINKSTGQIIGHNGRHRIRALEMAGIEAVEIEVQLHDADGYMIKYGAETIPDMAVSSQFDTKIETHISNIIPMNKAHREEILSSYGEKAHPGAAVKYSITGENDAVENEKAIRKLENEIEDINSKLDLASVDGLSETEIRRLRNQLTKSQYELDQRNAAERKAAVRTPLQSVLDNLDNYRAIDLESIANQLTDNVWDDVETLSTEELKSGIREIIQERAGDMSPLEMQSPKFGVYVRKPSTSAGVRYSITPEFEQWYRSMFDNPADADASIGKAKRYSELMQKYGEMDEASNAVRETPVPVKSTEKKAVSETVRTVMGAEATPNSRIPTIVEAVVDGKLAHVPTANNVYARRAAGTLRREGWAKTLRDWTAEVRSGKSSPDLVAMGAVLLNNAGNSNATGTEYLDILSDYVELMSRNGKSLQMGNLFKTLSPEGRLYMAEKIAKNINEKIRERKGKKTKAAEDAALDDIIEVRDTALQTIKDIFDALSEDRNKTSHGIPVEDWMKEIGTRLAGQISSNLTDKVQRQRPITKVIQEDLLKFAESYALPKGKNLGVERRASDRVADFFNNRKAYAEAWNQARSELRNRYKDDPEKLDALEEFLNGTLGYNGAGSDAVMMRAVAEFALDGDTKARDIVMRSKLGDRKALEARVFNALNSKVQATGSDAAILRDAVSRFVSNTLADSGIDAEKALANSVKSAMKDIGVKMSDIIRQGAESKEAVANRIADMLVKEYKVSQEGADEAARIVVDKFTEMTAEAAQTKLESMFKARPTRAERSLLLRFDELVNLGAFTSNQFNHLATQKIFGVGVQIDPALIDEYRAAKTDTARDEVLDKITTNIAEQIPATKMEQFTALRYLNMLGNLKTQARNVVGNLAYQPVRMMKDQVGAAIETAAQNIFGMDIERTKAFGRDMETYKFGLKDFEEVRQIIMGGGKYNDNARFSQDIESKRRIFKSALLEKYRVLTNEAMDIGDAVFSKLAYADALSGYMKANGTTWSKASEELRDKARVYAIQQAAEATYRDNNVFSDAISQMRIPNADTWAKQAINTIGEGVMPFRKTPANILVRTVEYSPVGIALSAINAGRAKAGADVTATQVIDQLAKGLTGSALMALGYALANLGVLRGGDDDEEKKAEFDDLIGHQAYAIELGGYSITMDWLAPEAVPLFLGAQVSKAMEDGAMSPGDVMRTLASIPDPILEMSMLQGLNDAIKNASSYGDDQALVRFTGNALWGYLTQGMTSTLMGQAVRAVNNTRMTTYVDKNSDMPSGMQSAIGKLTAKLPLPKALKYNQIPYIDAWGRMEQNADNAAMNFVFQFANPAYVSKVNVSDTESELERLYGATKNTSVLPQRAPKKFSHDGQVINLTADQYVVFASDVGRTSYNTVTDLTGSKLYQNLSDADKARAVENVYDYAKQTAKESLVGYKVDSWVKEAGASGDPALYCAIKAATYNVEGIPDPKDPGKSISNSKGLQVMEIIYKMPGLTEKQKRTYIELFAGKSIQGYSESKVKRELEKMRRQAAK